MDKEGIIRQKDANNRWERRKSSPLILELYPDVLEITLDLNLDYPNAFSIHQKTFIQTFTPNDKAFFEINCINRDCLFSDLYLNNEVSDTIRRKKSTTEGIKICNGFNTFKCYVMKSGTCMTKLTYTIKIKYKNAL